MMKKILLFLTVILALIVGVVKFSGIKLNKVTVGNKALVLGDNQFQEKFLNKPLPAFTLKDINGNVVDSKKLEGKTIHINFWSVYCIPCIEEFADLNKLKTNFQNDVVFIAIAPETTAQVKKTIARNPFNYIIIPNGQAYFNALGIKSYPKNFFVDKKGVIRNIVEGSQSEINVSSASVSVTSANFTRYSKILAGLK